MIFGSQNILNTILGVEITEHTTFINAASVTLRNMPRVSDGAVVFDVFPGQKHGYILTPDDATTAISGEKRSISSDVGGKEVAGSVLEAQGAVGAQILASAVESSTSWVCPKCNGVVALARKDAHVTTWCDAL